MLEVVPLLVRGELGHGPITRAVFMASMSSGGSLELLQRSSGCSPIRGAAPLRSSGVPIERCEQVEASNTPVFRISKFEIGAV